MDLHRQMSFFSILTISLLLSLASSTTTSTSTFPSTSPSPPTSSILAAAETLRTRGYSLFSSALISAFPTSSSSAPNFSATILAAPDFLFPFSPNPTRPRPSTTLLYHTLKPTPLRWLNLTSLPDGNELPTLHNHYCLFLFKKPNGGVSISSSKKHIFSVNIRYPDLYADENLVVHGVDGVLDPRTGDKCSSSPISDDNTTVKIRWVHRSFLDHAIRVLRRKRFHVAATALAMRRAELLTLPAVTVFAPSDKALFSSQPNGFRYDFRRHVAPKRLRFTNLLMCADGAEYETLAPNKTVFVQSTTDAVSVNGIRVDGDELYHNRWIVVYSLPTTLDEAAAGEFVGSGGWDGKFPGVRSEYFGNGVPTAAGEGSREFIGPTAPAPAPESRYLGPIESGASGVPPVSDRYVGPIEDTDFGKPPSPSNQCDVVSAVTVGVDSGADLFCPVNDVAPSETSDDVKTFYDVVPSQPSDDVNYFHLFTKLLQSDPLISVTNNYGKGKKKDDKGQVSSDENDKKNSDSTNVAADLFYYTL